jgi:hypothetical protein
MPQHIPIKEQILVELMEPLADIEHQRWADWQEYVHGLCVDTEIVAPESNSMRYDAKAFPKMLFTRWERQINTSYAELSEKEKEKDREQVRRYLPLLSQSIDRILTEVEKRVEGEKQRYCKEDVLLQKNKPYDWHGFSHGCDTVINIIAELKK